eukprot:TRINITY_DN440_c0_g1_i4.p1 TRINITY_DN440_c0_g1~~TRINITY_DN440_c0_g1_i4.p1  ORF type:complete len:265 (+),score=57.02 TRINITY_DN440_c0_g1_i4:1202-1996(+)
MENTLFFVHAMISGKAHNMGCTFFISKTQSIICRHEVILPDLLQSKDGTLRAINPNWIYLTDMEHSSVAAKAVAVRAFSSSEPEFDFAIITWEKMSEEVFCGLEFLKAPDEVVIGSKVKCHGHPYLLDAFRYARTYGRIVSASSDFLFTDCGCIPGFSGGVCVFEEKICGMIIGTLPAHYGGQVFGIMLSSSRIFELIQLLQAETELCLLVAEEKDIQSGRSVPKSPEMEMNQARRLSSASLGWIPPLSLDDIVNEKDHTYDYC